jgi:hypothetical protein
LQQIRREPAFWLLIVSYVSFASFYTALLFSLLPILEARGLAAVEAIALYSLIGPAQLGGRLGVFVIDRFMSLSIAGLAGTLLPVAAMVLLMTLEPISPLSLLFPVLFGAGMGIKTVVQATAAPQLLGRIEYGTLQGIIALPVYVAQALAPFVAAVIWQATGRSHVLEHVLLGAAILSAAAFACALALAPQRRAARARSSGC